MLLVGSVWRGGAGSRGDFIVVCPNALAASDACFVTDRWFTPPFPVLACFRIDAWMADVACPVICQPIWPACWLDTPDRSYSSAARVVQDVGPIRSRRLGGRAVGGRGSGRLYRASQGDEVDVHCAQYFVNSSLAPVVLFRRRLQSVADVLKGIRDKGFTQSRWDALLGYWEAVCRHGPCGPISSLHPWDGWIPPGLHGFYRWVSDSLELLNGFLKQVVASRRTLGFASGPGGFVKILVLGRMLGVGRTSFLLHHFLSSRTLRPSHLVFG